MFTNTNTTTEEKSSSLSSDIMEISNKPTDRINLLLQLGKIGTRVQILKENGDLYPDQLFFKSLSSRKMSWCGNKKSIIISPYVLILPGKITGLLSISPQVKNIPDELCLGIVSKEIVLECIFQNARDREIWSAALDLLVSSQSLHFVKSRDVEINNTNTLWNGNDIIQWHEITNNEKQKIEHFYPFLLNSYKGAMFNRYTTNKLKLPENVLIKLNRYGDKLFCIDSNNNILFQMPFDSEIIIIDPKDNHFRHAPSSIHCFSIIRNQQILNIGCNDIQQYNLWRYGIQYLCDKRNHSIRMKTRRAILAGDLSLSPKKQLIQSPSKQQSSSSSRQQSTQTTSKFWGSLFG